MHAFIHTIRTYIHTPTVAYIAHIYTSIHTHINIHNSVKDSVIVPMQNNLTTPSKKEVVL
jgi:hypothetical protein